MKSPPHAQKLARWQPPGVLIQIKALRRPEVYPARTHEMKSPGSQHAPAQMRLRYDEDLVEAAVFLCGSGPRREIPPLQLARFHRQREKLYSILEPDERQEAFFRFHLDWFREWGLETILTESLREFPLLKKALTVLVFRKTVGKKDEGSELHVNETGERTGIVAIQPELLLQRRESGTFLRHELMHLHDMVDPAFGYRPELPTFGTSIYQTRLSRERYRLLWDVSIDGRLTGAAKDIMSTKGHRWSEFSAAFGFWPEARQQSVFESLWKDAAPTHQRLVELVCEPRQLQPGAGPQPGAPCPLCGFPTFAWASASKLGERTTTAIRSEFPDWTVAQGACARCAEIYRVNYPQTSIV